MIGREHRRGNDLLHGVFEVRVLNHCGDSITNTTLGRWCFARVSSCRVLVPSVRSPPSLLSHTHPPPNAADVRGVPLERRRLD